MIDEQTETNYNEFIQKKSISLEEQKYIAETIKDLDQGLIRVAEKNKDGWQINEWVKKLFYYILKPEK